VKRLRSEEGTASLEFIIVAVGILLPLTYIVLTVGAIHRAHAAAGHAVREASRIVMQADSYPAGHAAAREAAVLAFSDHGLVPPDSALQITCTGTCLAPGSQATVTVAWDMPLPWIPEALYGPVTWPIRDSQTLVFDLYRSDPL
jgi:Flp pilus assembly protein TadG